MDPVSIGLMASTALSAGASLLGANAQEKAGKAQQAAAERQALEERAAGQSAAAGELKKAKLAQSSLFTQAGASGSGASDPTVMQLFGDIEAQGQLNSGVAMAQSQQRADNISYQAALDRWKADSDARMKRIGAVGTLLSGGLKAYGTPMGTKYGRPDEDARTGTGWDAKVNYYR